MFFHRCGYKKAVLVSWRTTLQCPCANPVIGNLRLKKDVLILKMLLCSFSCATSASFLGTSEVS